jgi:hypothetical protein
MLNVFSHGFSKLGRQRLYRPPELIWGGKGVKSEGGEVNATPKSVRVVCIEGSKPFSLSQQCTRTVYHLY